MANIERPKFEIIEGGSNEKAESIEVRQVIGSLEITESSYKITIEVPKSIIPQETESYISLSGDGFISRDGQNFFEVSEIVVHPPMGEVSADNIVPFIRIIQ